MSKCSQSQQYEQLQVQAQLDPVVPTPIHEVVLDERPFGGELYHCAWYATKADAEAAKAADPAKAGWYVVPTRSSCPTCGGESHPMCWNESTAVCYVLGCPEPGRRADLPNPTDWLLSNEQLRDLPGKPAERESWSNW